MKSKVFFCKFVFEKSENKPEEAGVGPFKKRLATGIILEQLKEVFLSKMTMGLEQSERWNVGKELLVSHMQILLSEGFSEGAQIPTVGPVMLRNKKATKANKVMAN